MDIDLKGLNIHLGSEPFEHTVEIGGKSWPILETFAIVQEAETHQPIAILQILMDNPLQFKARFAPHAGLPNEGLDIEVRIAPRSRIKLAGRLVPHMNLQLRASGSNLSELSFDARMQDEIGPEGPVYTHVEGVLLNVQPLDEFIIPSKG